MSYPGPTEAADSTVAGNGIAPAAPSRSRDVAPIAAMGPSPEGTESMKTVLLTLASLSMESGKAVGFGPRMQRDMMANGSKTSVMARVAKHGKMAASMRVNSKTVNLKVSVGWNGTWQTA